MNEYTNRIFTEDNIELNESEYPRLIKMIKDLVPEVKTFGVVSWENNLANSALADFLKKEEYSFRQIQGKFDSFINPFFINNIQKNELVELSMRSKQKSVIFGEVHSNNDLSVFLINCNTKNESGSKLIHTTINNNKKRINSEYRGRIFLIPFYDKDEEVIDSHNIFLRSSLYEYDRKLDDVDIITGRTEIFSQLRKYLMKPEEVIRKLNNDAYSRLNRIIHGQIDSINTIAIISIENAGSKNLSPEENKKRTFSLLNELRHGHFGFVQILGPCRNSEICLVIVNITKDIAIHYGMRWHQKSIVWAQKKKDNNTLSFEFELIEGKETTQAKPIIFSEIKPVEIEDFDLEADYDDENDFFLLFFDYAYVPSPITEGSILNKRKQKLDEDVYRQIIDCVEMATSHTGFSSYTNRGMIKNLLKKNNAWWYDD